MSKKAAWILAALLIFAAGFGTAWWLKPGPKVYLAPPEGMPQYSHDLILGNPKAPRLGLYLSYRCPYCEAFYQECWEELLSDYVERQKLCLVLRLIPGAGSPHELQAARYLQCLSPEHLPQAHTALQEWKSRDSLWPEEALANFQSPELKACIEKDAVRRSVLAAQIQAEEDGIHLTPAFWFPNKVVMGYEGKKAFFERVREMVE